MVLCACALKKSKLEINTFDVGMEKEQKQELGWRVSVLPIPAFHCIYCVLAKHNYNISQWWNAGMDNTDTLHPKSCFCSFPSLYWEVQ